MLERVPAVEPQEPAEVDTERVVPEGCKRIALQMDEVRRDIRRVGEEEQPERAETDEDDSSAAPPPAVVDEDGEREWNPRQEQVPDQITKVDVARVDVAREYERNAKKRSGEQAEDRREPAPAGLHVSPPPRAGPRCRAGR